MPIPFVKRIFSAPSLAWSSQRPRWAKRVPRSPEDGRRGPPEGPKTAQEAPRRAPRRPKSALRRPKRRPRRPGGPQHSPTRGPRGGARTDSSSFPVSEAPRMPREAPKGPQTGAQEGPRGRPQEARELTCVYFEYAFDRFRPCSVSGFPTLPDGPRGPENRLKTAHEVPKGTPRPPRELSLEALMRTSPPRLCGEPRWRSTHEG